MAFCEVNPELRKKIAAEYCIERSYADLHDAMADDWDAAVIAVPAHLHVPMALQLAEAGVSFLMEKPVSVGMQDVLKLQGLVQSRRLTVAVGYDLRTHPSLQAMREAIRSGRFGRPLEAVAVSGHHFPTARPAYREIYYNNRATGGGAVQDALTHNMNAVEWLVGPIDALVADITHQSLDGVDVEDTAHVLARHGNVLSSCSLNQYQTPSEFTITVVCERGTARFEPHRNRWRWMSEPDGGWHDEPCPRLDRDAGYVAEANAFLDALNGRGVVLCSLDEGVQTLRANLAVLASAERKAWQTTQSIG